MGFFLRETSDSAASLRPGIEWEEIGCLLCGSRNWTQLVEAADSTPGGSGLFFVVVQCQDCGLCFTNPRPSAQSIGQFYPAAYKPHQPPATRRHGGDRGTEGQRDRGTEGRGDSWLFSAPLRLSARLKTSRRGRFLPWHGQGRLLDFGCGGGSFLERMHRQGWTVTGLDMSAAAVQRIRAELKLEALVGTLPHSELKPASFDVITMWQVLEHLHQPLEALRAARDLLVPGGKLLVAVPNIDSFPFRWFGHAWYGLDLPRHLVHFAPWTLKLMLQRAGFQIESLQLLRHSKWLRASADLACRTGEAPLWHSLVKTKIASRLLTWYSYWTHQTDCVLASATTGAWELPPSGAGQAD